MSWSGAGKLSASERSGGGRMPVGESQKGDSVAAGTAWMDTWERKTELGGAMECVVKGRRM